MTGGKIEAITIDVTIQGRMTRDTRNIGETQAEIDAGKGMETGTVFVRDTEIDLEGTDMGIRTEGTNIETMIDIKIGTGIVVGTARNTGIAMEIGTGKKTRSAIRRKRRKSTSVLNMGHRKRIIIISGILGWMRAKDARTGSTEQRMMVRRGKGQNQG